MNAWLVEGASVVGESHVRRGRPNDDAIAIEQSGKWTAVVLSDGAGSAKRAREGSNLVAGAFCSELLKIADLLDRSGPGPWLNDAVIHGTLEVRRALAAIAGSYDLQDFHCTLVAVLISDRGGFTVHIGDGAILVGRKVDEDTSEYGIHSYPENGEYANETFFVTEGNWLKNIRIKPLGECEWVILTTDGAAALFLDKDLKCEVIEPLLKSVLVASENRNLQNFLDEFLDNTYAKNCSNDDKTLAIAFKQSRSLLHLNRRNNDNGLITENSKSITNLGVKSSTTTEALGPATTRKPNGNDIRPSELSFGVHQGTLLLAFGAISSVVIMATVIFLYVFNTPRGMFCISDQCKGPEETHQDSIMRFEDR